MNLVNELQVSAENDHVLTVLRKTTRLASKLDRQDILQWLECEQSGYGKDHPIPKYREVGTLLAMKTNGFVPMGFGKIFSGTMDLPPAGLTVAVPIPDPISTIMSWMESGGDGKEVASPIDRGTPYDMAIRSFYQVDPMFAHQISFVLHYNSAQIRAIPERIRDKVLEWACALERAGVTGEGLSFSAKEKQIAHSVTFNNYGCHIEQLSNSGLNQKA
jgi:hypothetical protein